MLFFLNRIFKYVIALAFLIAINIAYADESPVAGYYWKGHNQEASTPNAVADLIKAQLGSDYCATSDLAPFGDPVAYKMTCYRSSGSTYSSWNIVRYTCSSSSTLDVCQAGYQPPVEMCSDGYPPNVYGYEDNCDRPTPKQCSDGTYVNATGYCPVSVGVCSDYDTCYQYAKSQASCSKTAASVFTFNYRDPTSFDFSCSTIDPSSPDHPDNGGNADGNAYNDPQSPETTTSGNADLSSLASAIGSELRGDFGNVERAVRDGTTAANANTDKTIDAINSAQTNLNNTLNDINTAIQQGNEADNGSGNIVDSINNASSNLSDSINQSASDISNTVTDGSNGVIDSVNKANQSIVSGNTVLSGQLSDISSKLDNIKPCDPNTDPKSCEGEHGISSGFITNVMDTLQNLFNDENDKALDSVKGEVTSIQDSSPLDSSVLDGLFDPILSIIPQPRECSPIIFAPSKPYSFTISCEFSDKFKSIFGFLIAIYTIQSLIGIVLSTTSPKSEGA